MQLHLQSPSPLPWRGTGQVIIWTHASLINVEKEIFKWQPVETSPIPISYGLSFIKWFFMSVLRVMQTGKVEMEVSPFGLYVVHPWGVHLACLWKDFLLSWCRKAPRCTAITCCAVRMCWGGTRGLSVVTQLCFMIADPKGTSGKWGKRSAMHRSEAGLCGSVLILQCVKGSVMESVKTDNHNKILIYKKKAE